MLTKYNTAYIKRRLSIAGLTISEASKLSVKELTRINGISRKSIEAIKSYKPTIYDIVVTRHPALKDYLLNEGLITAETKAVKHITAKELEGLNVIGILPIDLAARCNTITTVALDLPHELRGVELTVEQIEQCFIGVSTYKVEEIK